MSDTGLPINSDLEKNLQTTLDGLLAGVPPKLAESIRYSLLAPGKRIRPRLVLRSSHMVSLPPKAATAAAIAIEMVHCYTLIHDDLPCMDDDDFRRGRPSNHKQFGEATALLAGDSLMALAIDALLGARQFIKPEALLDGITRLSSAMGARGVIAGQAAEMCLSSSATLRDLRAMHAKKTGELFSASILLPSDLVSLDKSSAKYQALTDFANELGLAFQVVDDLEDSAQDQGKRNPANILHYLSENDARSSTLDGLNSATRHLVDLWREDAEPLAEIAREVKVRLE